MREYEHTAQSSKPSAVFNAAYAPTGDNHQ